MNAFTPVCRAVKLNESIPDSARRHLEAVLSRISSDVASALYIDLCRIQIAHDTKETPRLELIGHLLNWKDESLLARFHRIVIDRGAIVNLVADSIELLSTRQRRERRLSQEGHLKEQAKTHLEESRWAAEWSRYMYNSRQANAAAYARVHERLAKNDAGAPLKEWEVVVSADPSALARRELTFWYAVQVSNCGIEEKAAVCHKLSLCDPGNEIIRRLRVQLHGDLFVAHHKHTRVAAAALDEQRLPPGADERPQLANLPSMVPGETTQCAPERAMRRESKETDACRAPPARMGTKAKEVSLCVRVRRMMRGRYAAAPA